MAPKTNGADLVGATVTGRIAPPRFHPEAMNLDESGRPRPLPGTGGIALGVHAGDLAARWIGDHLMPGASIEDANATPAQPGALHLLGCIGNRVRDGAGRAIGVIAGKRGGLAPGFWAPQLVGVEVPDAVAATLNCEDKVVVEAVGRGLEFIDHPGITLSNASPRLVEALPLSEKQGLLTCEVCAIIPPEVAGSGLGQDSWVGDLEITDARLTGALRFADLVAFTDIDAAVTRYYRPGHISIGIVSHGPGHAPGHGVGVTILLTGTAERLRAVLGQGALADELIAWSSQAGPA
jgi:hypothetical protein